MTNKIKLLYLLKTPITYQARMLRLLSEDPHIDLTVLYRSQTALKNYYEPNLKLNIQWDIPMLEGYHSEFLPVWKDDNNFSFFKPLNYGLWQRMRKGQYQVLWVHGYTTWLDWLAIVYAKLLGMKILLRGESTLLLENSKKIKTKIKPLFFRLLNKFTDCFLAIGSLNKAFYQHYQIPNKKIILAPYTVDNSLFQHPSPAVDTIREKLRIPQDNLVLLSTSKLMPRKRINDILSAYELLCQKQPKAPKLTILLVGSGKEETNLKRRVTEQHWQNVHFLGFKNQTDLPAYYQIADIYVLPSAAEPWGLVINEAMSAGCAILASDQVGSAYDLVENDFNGFVYPCGDAKQLAKYIQRLLDDKELCEKMKKNSKQKIATWRQEETVAGVVSACLEVSKKRSNNE